MPHRIPFHGFDPCAKFEIIPGDRLPHWTQPGGAYFVTFRLGDSVPIQLQQQWNYEREIWLQNHRPPWTREIEAEYHERFTGRMEAWLDAGMGACHLRRPDIRAQAEKHLRHFDGERYHLDAFVIMPNHVHALIVPLSGHGLFAILKGIKGTSARTCNSLLSRSGQTFWMADCYNRIVRDGRELRSFRNYIEQNPVKAKLGSDEFTLSMSEVLYIPGVDDTSQ